MPAALHPPPPPTLVALRAASPAARLRAERLVDRNRKLVHWAVGRVLGLRDGHDRDEAAAEGLLVLWRAALGFDPARGVKFSTYAVVSLRRGLLNWRERQQGLKVGGAFVGPLVVHPSGAGDPPARAEVDPVLSDAEFERLVAAGRLEPREELVLRRRFRDGRTLDAVGAELGVSKERARQIELAAVRAVRAAVNPAVRPPVRSRSVPRRHCADCGLQIPNVGTRTRCRPGKGCRADEPPAPLLPPQKISAGLAAALAERVRKDAERS